MNVSESCWKLRPAILLWILIFFCGSVLLFIDYRLPYREMDVKMTLIYPLKSTDHKIPIRENLRGYLIKTTGCRIPDMDPFDPTVREYIYKENPIKCNVTLPPLVEANLTSLSVIKSSFKAYKIKYLDVFVCCYFVFKRYDPKKDEEDNDILINRTCVKFKYSILIKDEFVKVKCFYNGSEIYKDFFCFVPPKFEINNEIQNSMRKPLSILIAGLDGVSRVNLHRQMRKTMDILKNELKAVEFLGYNKIGDNTFPNLIAILTGLSEDELSQVCWSNNTDHFDNCPFIWKKYKQKKFVTSYAEDASWMGIFNYQKNGFCKQPTDYYWRTFSFTADKQIGNQILMNNNLCLGARLEYKILLDYIKNFVDSMRIYKKAFFNFFWSAGLSHDFLNYPRFGDNDFAKLFNYLHKTDTLNQTVLIFLSDHGIRWSGIRSTNQGMLEERLPFLFITLPKWYKKEFPMVYENLQRNSKRLTTPYDLHYTLRDLLDPYKLTSNFLKKRNQISSESRSYSLFDNIPENRTCDSANIPSHWCACQENVEIEVNSTMAVEATEFAVAYLNAKISDFKQCQNLTLKKIISAKVSFSGNISSLGEGAKKDFTVSFVTVPGDAIFEATVRQTFFKENGLENKELPYTLKITGTVSRLNLYGSQSDCVSDFHMKLYCYCNT
ncbi:uncharacterized protein LOC108732897 [Agrilus planipennis]|uniref:Uncharacterized protein LOC108732897 n=1 Tax=Agrilus planipennis TaxID=224129 RepID=A0A1W4W5L0_AGRPL|nr:uncharacterized protein LOC108732897 [Agrilus planipennis]XP_018319399.1 uncharacterized protein LOC108732897 [Agrilus planipennis]